MPPAAQLRQSFWDVAFGMVFSNVVMYFIMLATAATLFVSGHRGIESAADVALALQPVAGKFASGLFAIGIIGVGMLAVPVMTTGAAYDVCQAVGARTGLGLKPNEAKLSYCAITVFTLAAMVLNLLGINPMHALVFDGIVQGFSTPPLMLLIMFMTNQRKIMGGRTNRRVINILGWGTTVVIWTASMGLMVGYFAH